MIIPSSSQVTEESLRRTDVEFKSQSTVFSSAPLPGSIVDYQDEILTHPSCSVENIAINKAAGHGKSTNSPYSTLVILYLSYKEFTANTNCLEAHSGIMTSHFHLPKNV